MREWVIDFFQQYGLSKEIITFIIAMTPIFELRGAIPLGIYFGFPWWKSFLIGVAGNIVPVIPLLILLEPIRKLLSNIRFFEKIFNWLYERTYKKSKNAIKYGAIGLSMFVAIPLPMTGAWTGSIAAILFDIKFKWAFPAIILGVITAGVIVTVTIVGFNSLINSIF